MWMPRPSTSRSTCSSFPGSNPLSTWKSARRAPDRLLDISQPKSQSSRRTRQVASGVTRQLRGGEDRSQFDAVPRESINGTFFPSRGGARGRRSVRRHAQRSTDAQLGRHVVRRGQRSSRRHRRGDAPCTCVLGRRGRADRREIAGHQPEPSDARVTSDHHASTCDVVAGRALVTIQFAVLGQRCRRVLEAWREVSTGG